VSSWRSGEFDRELIPRVWHAFTPAHAAESLTQIDLQSLWNRGKRLLLLDVDNTLVEWKQENFSPQVIDWIKRAQSMGFEICIISNTRRILRLARISEMLGVETVRGRFKPSRAMYRLALIKFKRKPEEAIMVGDQMMTDILGANRAGIEAIWVRKMDGPEFRGTKINRFVEGLLTSAVYKALVTPIDETPDGKGAERAKPLADRTIVHQLLKFAVVGGTSFVIDFSISYFLMKVIHSNGQLISIQLGNYLRSSFPDLFRFATDAQGAAAPIMGAVAALIAMGNSFIWNRSWTFEVRGKEERMAQLRRFYFISIIGNLINVGLFTLVYNYLPGSRTLRFVLGKVFGAGVAAVWNFLGSRLYAFRKS